MMKRTRIFIAGTAAALLICFAGCDKKVGKPQLPGPPPPGTISACDTITYTKHIRPIVEVSCRHCHNSTTQSGNTIFESYEQFKAKAEQGRIKARVIDGTGGYMPRDKGKLPQDKLDLISCWLGNGMKP